MLTALGASMLLTAIGLGTKVWWESRLPRWPTPWDETKHYYVRGKTGTGKTNFLLLLAKERIKRGHGLMWMCPEDAARKLLAHIPENRIDDVIVICPTDVGEGMGEQWAETVYKHARKRYGQPVKRLRQELRQRFETQTMDFGGVVSAEDYGA